METPEVNGQDKEETKSLSTFSILEKLTVRSSARSSASTRASMVAALTMAEAQAAKVKAAYADKEMNIKIEMARIASNAQMEKARLDAAIEALQLQKEADAAIFGFFW